MKNNVYKKLVKSNLGLDSKNIIADIIAEENRCNMSAEWDRINHSKYNKFVDFIRENGYLQLELPNKNELVSELNSYFKQLKNAERKNEIIDLGDISELSSVNELKKNRELRELVSVYLNCPAICYRINSWWQLPYKEQHINASNAQKWHRDRDDFRFITLFVYLTDVDMGSGPHCFIPKSHDPIFLERKLEKNKSKYSEYLLGNKHAFLDDEVIREIFGEQDLKIWTGRKGTAFLEDTQGLHKASMPRKNARLIMQMRWGISDSTIEQ